MAPARAARPGVYAETGRSFEAQAVEARRDLHAVGEVLRAEVGNDSGVLRYRAASRFAISAWRRRTSASARSRASVSRWRASASRWRASVSRWRASVSR
jgi:hypothetical protein